MNKKWTWQSWKSHNIGPSTSSRRSSGLKMKGTVLDSYCNRTSGPHDHSPWWAYSCLPHVEVYLGVSQRFMYSNFVSYLSSPIRNIYEYLFIHQSLYHYLVTSSLLLVISNGTLEFTNILSFTKVYIITWWHLLPGSVVFHFTTLLNLWPENVLWLFNNIEEGVACPDA